MSDKFILKGALQSLEEYNRRMQSFVWVMRTSDYSDLGCPPGTKFKLKYHERTYSYIVIPFDGQSFNKPFGFIVEKDVRECADRLDEIRSKKIDIIVS